MITRIAARKWEKALAPNSNHHSHSTAGISFTWAL